MVSEMTVAQKNKHFKIFFVNESIRGIKKITSGYRKGELSGQQME